MSVEIRDGKRVVAKGDTSAEAMVRLKDTEGDALFYPTVDGNAVHVRRKNKQGDYHNVAVLKIQETG